MVKLMDHNVEVRNSIIKNLLYHNELLYVTATGTGKSFVSSNIIDTLKLRTLILYPTNCIKDLKG